jgi:hypothetical protein
MAVRERLLSVLSQGTSRLTVAAALLTVCACGGSAGHRDSTIPAGDLQVTRGSCSRGFELSLASDRGGQATPVAAANWFAAHGGVAELPQAGWTPVDSSGGQATLSSGRSTVHVVQGPDQTWQVDSGHNCG